MTILTDRYAKTLLFRQYCPFFIKESVCLTKI